MRLHAMPHGLGLITPSLRLLPPRSAWQLLLNACDGGAELDVLVTPVERTITEEGDYDEMAFQWGTIRVSAGRAASAPVLQRRENI